MAIQIGTVTTLKDFTRRDFLASSALTAVLFTAALLLHRTGSKTDGKGPEVRAQSSVSSSSLMQHR
jgi:nitrate/nitrite transport system substrate-binding protein